MIIKIKHVNYKRMKITGFLFSKNHTTAMEFRLKNYLDTSCYSLKIFV